MFLKKIILIPCYKGIIIFLIWLVIIKTKENNNNMMNQNNNMMNNNMNINNLAAKFNNTISNK